MKDETSTIYQAIAHPDRRRILESLIAADMPAMNFDVDLSPSALSQHLTVLKGAGLVTEKRVGRNRIYSLQAKPLYGAFQWLSKYEGLWAQKFDELESFLEGEYGNKGKEDKVD